MMSQWLCFFLLVLSYLQGSTQKSSSRLRLNEGTDQTSLNVSRWKMRFPSEIIPDNAEPDIKTRTSKNRGKNNFHIEGTFAVPRPVPFGYEYFHGIGYYKFYPLGSKSFKGAYAICRNDGAYLAILNSDAEMEVLRSIFARHSYVLRYAYLGFHDQKEEGNFVTIFGDPLREAGYERWLDEEPNQLNGNEDCGTMHRSGSLNDYPCERSFEVPFFCEYDPFIIKAYEMPREMFE